MTTTPPIITAQREVIQITVEKGKAPKLETSYQNPEQLLQILHQVYLKVVFSTFGMWGAQAQQEAQQQAAVMSKIGRAG